VLPEINNTHHFTLMYVTAVFVTQTYASIRHCPALNTKEA